jgi:hypothetical protein
MTGKKNAHDFAAGTAILTDHNHNRLMNKTTIVAMGLYAFIALTTNQTQAQEGGGHSHFTKIPAAVEDIWKEIHKQQTRLVSTVAKKDLGEAHDHAFAIRDLVKALPAKVPAASKVQAEEGAKEIAQIAADIDKSGAARAQKATEAGVKKMGEAITALQTKLQPAKAKN